MACSVARSDGNHANMAGRGDWRYHQLLRIGSESPPSLEFAKHWSYAR
jgi:hypothetical protein